MHFAGRKNGGDVEECEEPQHGALVDKGCHDHIRLCTIKTVKPSIVTKMWI